MKLIPPATSRISGASRQPGAARSRATWFALGAFAALSVGCASPTIYPLQGEDPEVGLLLGQTGSQDARATPMSAARRLHQALVQQDTETAFGLLSAATRKALDDRGAAAGTSGRELIDDSTLPGPGGTLRRVRFESIFFGLNLADLRDLGPVAGTPADAVGARHALVAVAEDGTETPLQMLRESDGWKLDRTGF